MLLKRTKNGLDKVTASIMDVDNSSLFDIFVPKQLRSGKNEIRIRLVNDGLVKGSDVLIDVLDQNKEPFYYEISDVANEDKSRSIIVHVTESDLTGNAYLYVYAKLGVESSYMTLINLEVNPELESEQEIKLSEPPEIFYSERRLATQTFSNQTRQVIKRNTNGTLSIISPIIPRQMIESTFTVEKAEIRDFKSNNTVGSGSTVQLPQHFDLAQIFSNGFPFSSSYKNGTIEINGINLEVPNNAVSNTPFLNQSYSASIVNVLSTSSIEIYPPFSKLIEYQTSTGTATKVYDRFNNQANFTCSFFETLTLSQTNYTQSYAVFDIFNLTPVAGKIDSVDISYKNLSLIGDNYEPLGNFKVKPVNYLIDSSSLFFDNEKGIIERPIGTFKNGVVDFQTYWQTSSLLSVTTTDSVPNGIKFSGNEVVFEPKIQFNPINRKETEWNLSFDFNLQPSQSGVPQLDIFVSGSNGIKTGILKDSPYQPYSSSNIGTYIGSITERVGKGSFNFSINAASRITPKFALRRGFLSIGNVTLTPVEKVGYNASQTRIYAPMNLPTGSEVNFKIDYVNPVGKRLSKFTSLLPGVYFEGSFKPTVNNLPSGTVSGSDQLTGSFDNRYERKGSGIYSSSGQLGPTGMYSGSGEVPRNTVVSASNIRFVSSPNGFGSTINSQFDTAINEGIVATNSPSSGAYSLSTGNSGDPERAYMNVYGGSANITLGYSNSGSGYRLLFSANQLAGTFISSSGENTTFYQGGPDGTYFDDNRSDIRGIEYGGNYTSSLINKDNSLAPVGLVKKIISGSLNGLFSGSQQVNYAQLSNIPSGILSSSNGFISSSNQVDYNTILNKLNVSGSGMYRLLISSGSESSSYANENLTFDTSQSRLNVTASLFLTGSSSTRMSYIWDGPKTLGATPGIVWTNMPNAKSTWLGTALTSDAHYIGDFTEITQGRLFTAAAVAGSVTSSLQVEYSLDGAAGWLAVVNTPIGNVAGLKDSGWVAFPAGARQFIYIRLVGLGGDGAADPRFSPPIALFR